MVNVPLNKADGGVGNRSTFPNPFATDRDGHMTFKSPLKIKSKRIKRNFAYFFLFVVIAEASWTFQQAIMIFTTESAEDVSLAALLSLIVTNTIWLLYSLILVPEVPILISAILMIVGTTLALIGKLTYG
jgi:uncharacterized protein with PQ loop repeat